MCPKVGRSQAGSFKPPLYGMGFSGQAPPHYFSRSQFSSVAQSCLTLCDPMDCSMPGLPVHHQLPESMSIESVMPSNHLILCHPLLIPPSIFPASRSFQMSQLFASGGQNIGVSASTSVLPMNTLVAQLVRNPPAMWET